MHVFSTAQPARLTPSANVGTCWHGGKVASPRTRLYDRHRKKDVYEGFGISAYWIVEPDRGRPWLTVFELRSGKYKQAAHVSGDEEYHAMVPFPVTIAASKLVTAR